MKLISIVTPCFNEEQNVEELHRRVADVMTKQEMYDYEHIFIDNCSTDGTVQILRRIAQNDNRTKIIVNARNFGHIRSPMHALIQAHGDAVIGLVADLQDPPELIPEMISKWEDGFAMVLCVKESSAENGLMFWLRRQYYRIIERLSEIRTFQNFHGFGLYDRSVIDAILTFDDPYPYFRGMIAEIGLPYCEIPYAQARRLRGTTKNNIYTLYDMAMLAVTQLSKIPLRFVTFVGFVTAGICVIVGLAYLLYKLLFWNRFSVGLAPIVIGVFFFASVQLISLGIMGEYIGSIYTHVRKRPYVIERERINF